MNKPHITDLDTLKRELMLMRLNRTSTKQETRAVSTIPPRDRSAPLPLSWAQQRLWFLSQFDAAAGFAYHMPSALRLSGRLDRQALRASLERIIARHEILRTRFSSDEGLPVQIVDTECGMALHEHDLRHLNGHEQEAAVERIQTDEAGTAFDLEHGPLIRGQLLRLDEDEHILLVTQHHIVSDGWSAGVLVKEFGALYSALSQGQEDPLAPLEIQYGDYAAWQRHWLSGEVLQGQLDYWRTQLSGAPALLDLPTDRARPAVQSYAGARHVFALPAGLTAQLKGLSQRHGCTLFMTLLAGWAVLLSRLSGQQDIVIGTPVANRQRSEVEGLIGFFVNTLALRFRLEDEPNVQALLAQAKAGALGAYSHQDVPFEQIVEALKPVRSLGHSPLFQSMLSLNNTPSGEELRLPGLELQVLEAQHHSAQFDLSLALSETAGGIVGEATYASDLFDDTTIARYMDYWQRLLEGMVADEERPVSRITILGEAEHRQVVTGFNATAQDYGPAQLIHQLNRSAGGPTPGRRGGAGRRAHPELSRTQRTRQPGGTGVAGAGRETDDRVAICVERSLDMVAGLLGILKAGGAYVPLDPGYPAERLAYMVQDSQPVALLTQARLCESVQAVLPEANQKDPAQAMPILLLDDAATWAGGNPGNPDPAALGLTAQHLAYVIYTSGSTGMPKGVMNQHGGVVNRLLWAQQTYALGSDDCVLQKTPFSFDVSVWELFLPLLAGAQLAMARPEGHKDPRYLHSAIAQWQVSTIHFVPSMLQSFLEQLDSPRCASLRRILCSGEALPFALRERVEMHLPAVELHNLYGPTEAAIDVTSWISRAQQLGQSEQSEQHPGRVPIGRPIANTQIYILDQHGQPVPVGVAGELYLGGAGVARGYLNRPELTAERFLSDPFSTDPQARLYKTGDLGRWLEDGNIEYLGRNDFQVKIRGFRIELGEIEARLGQCAGVREATVVAREEAAGDKRLVAYIVADGEVEVTAAGLRRQLQGQLPEYMVPHAYVMLEAMPLTPNGKLDRKALPAPERQAQTGTGYQAPQGEVEHTIAALWQDLLGIEQVGRHDNFFELGGHSLLAVQLVSRLRQTFGVEIALRQVFSDASLENVAAAVREGARSASAAILPVDRMQALPLSYAQQRLWFLNQLAPGSAFYNMPTALRLKGNIDTCVLTQTVNEIVRRHESLRTTFDLLHGEPVQIIAPELLLNLSITDLAGTDCNARESIAHQLMETEAQRPFDLKSGPLIRASLLRMAESDHILLFTMHHIVSDGWSLGALMREVHVLYAAYVQGLPSPLAPLAVQYADFAYWQRRRVNEEGLRQQLDYWKACLADAPKLLALPTDRPRPTMQSHRGSTLSFIIHRATTLGLHSVARQSQATLFMVLNASLNVLLSRLTGQDDICVGTAVANRNRTEIEPMIGFFVNTLVLRTRIDSDDSFLALLQQVRAATLDAYDRQDAPFDLVVDAVKPERSVSYSPLFQVMLILQNAHAETLELPGLLLETVDTGHSTAKFDFRLAISEGEDGRLMGDFEYSTDLFDATTIERMAKQLVCLLDSIAKNPGCRIADLAMQSTQERQHLLAVWNNDIQPSFLDISDADLEVEQATHNVLDLLGHFAEVSPDNVALAWCGQEMNFRRLDELSNRIANTLVSNGAEKGTIVAILLENPLSQIVATLGIAKAGCVFASLNVDYPTQRLHDMCNVISPSWFITEASCFAAVKNLANAQSCDVLLMDESSLAPAFPDADGTMRVHACTHQPDGKPSIDIAPDDPCYIYFTSGSTGLPKAVLGRTKGLAHFVQWEIAELGLDARTRASQLTPATFHVFLREVFTTLCAGGTLCIPSAGTVLDPVALANWLEADNVTLLHCVPSVFGILLDGQLSESRLPCLQHVVVGGGGLLPPAVNRWNGMFGKRIALVGVYGQTETTLAKFVYRIPSERIEESFVPIGRPIPGAQAILLKDNLEPCAPGEVGEIHLRTPYRSLGYYNDSERSNAAFVRNPFTANLHDILYRTGDLAIVLPDGNFRFMGRKDFQVKIRGMRVEPGEIESALMSLPQVAAAVVLAMDAAKGDASGDANGEKRLVAYVVGREGDAALDRKILRACMLASLPDHMVPAHIVILERLPLTANGKVDRNALPVPDMSEAKADYISPRNPTEESIARIWGDILDCERVGIQDDFFALGGHSLMAAQVASRLRAHFGIDLPLQALFESTTVEALGIRIDYANWLHASVTDSTNAEGRDFYEIEEI